MNFATKNTRIQILVWLFWFFALLVFGPPEVGEARPTSQDLPWLGVVQHEPRHGALFPWTARARWKKWAGQHYRAGQRAARRAQWAARGARVALAGAVSLADLVNWLTNRQQASQVGALPVLYALLETLQVRQIVNRHCPTRGEVDHGTVAVVLILNRLMFPVPLYQVADWVGRTVLATVMGVPAAKFNDDRLGRTLDALAPHLETIWLEVVERALLKAEIDLSVIFYDLTAFIAHGRYAASEVVDFGFAHNTPMNKRKFKLGLNVTADGHLPWLYRGCSGQTADQATVAENMDTLATWLQQRGYPLAATLIVGDRAMLNAELALAYDRHGLRHLTGLRCVQKEHQALLTPWAQAQFMAYPLEPGPAPQYWGRGCTVPFTHAGQTVRHKGLVVLSGPMQTQLRQSRQRHLDALAEALHQLRAKIGQPRYRTVKALTRSAKARCRASPVGDLMTVTVYETAAGGVNLQWQVNAAARAQAEQLDGRYLLVTNAWTLSHPEMLALYRAKDGVEKRFTVCKKDLRVSPVYLHQDQRIAAMLGLNMLALLAYSLLERQVRQAGLQVTTRKLIQQLEALTLMETHYRDGSCLRRLTPVTPEVACLLQVVAQVLAELLATPALRQPPLLPPESGWTPPPSLCLC